MTFRKSLLIAAVLVAGLLFLLPVLRQTYSPAVGGYGAYYRLRAAYLHAGQKIGFNVVVGCGVRVTSYRGGDSASVDIVGFDPAFFVKATDDGGAILIDVPEACGGQTTANGRVPKDLLPAVVWFDDKKDLTFGTGYVSEDAYQSPKSKLQFLGASIEPVTRQEWKAFQSANAQNLIDPGLYTGAVLPPQPKTDKERLDNFWNRKKISEWYPWIHCYGYSKVRIDDADVRAKLRAVWPAGHPQFWAPSKPQLSEIYHFINNATKVDGGTPWRETTFDEIASGYPTRTGGGYIPRNGYPRKAVKIYPRRAEDGIPWWSRSIANATTIYRDVETAGGDNAGFVYCYFWAKGLANKWLPGYPEQRFELRIDGEIMQSLEPKNYGSRDVPEMFFERDEYIYRDFRSFL